MSKCPLGFGKCPFSYLYILGTPIIRLFQDYLVSLDDINKNLDFNLFSIKTTFREHSIIRIFYKFLSYIIFGSLHICFLIIKKKEVEHKNNHNTKPKNSLIYNNKIIIFSKSINFQIIIACSIFPLQSILRKILNSFKVKCFDLWIFNMVFILIFMNYYFGEKIYRHKKISLIFIFFTNLGLLLVSTFIKTYNLNKLNAYEYIEIIFGNSLYCILIYFLYLLLSCLSSFCKVLEKKLMDINYVSPYLIIVYTGLFGFLLSSITLIFTTFISCGQWMQNFCNVSSYDNEYKYLDNVKIYFLNLKNQYINDKNGFYIEIFIVYPLFLVFLFIEFTFEIIIVFYLNPNYLLICDCLYNCTRQILSIIFEEKENLNYYKSFNSIISELLAILGYSIYLEIIELRFCELNKDIKINIIKRGLTETIKDDKLKIGQLYDIDKDSDDDESTDNDNKNLEIEMKEIKT